MISTLCPLTHPATVVEIIVRVASFSNLAWRASDGPPQPMRGVQVLRDPAGGLQCLRWDWAVFPVTKLRENYKGTIPLKKGLGAGVIHGRAQSPSHPFCAPTHIPPTSNNISQPAVCQGVHTLAPSSTVPLNRSSTLALAPASEVSVVHLAVSQPDSESDTMSSAAGDTATPANPSPSDGTPDSTPHKLSIHVS